MYLEVEFGEWVGVVADEAEKKGTGFEGNWSFILLEFVG